jgi:hypothetical protein
VSRLVALLLSVLFSFSLISPALADADSNIPACCRRAGKHACELAGHRHHSSGPRIATEACPQFPGVRAIPASAKLTGLTPTTHTYFFALINPCTRRERTQALYRISYSRTGQKRGPPALLA